MYVTLHLGAHRTGTGGLLGAMMANVGPLSGAGIRLWQMEDLCGVFGSDSGRKVARVKVSETRRTERALARLQEALDATAREGITRLVIVAPDVLGTTAECVESGVLYPGARDRLAVLAPAIASRCDRVTLAIRNGDRWWTSLMAKDLVAGGDRKTTESLDRVVTHPRSWRHLIQEIGMVLPQAETVVWPSEVLSDLPERQIVALTGDADGPLLTPYRATADATPDAESLEKLLEERGTPAHLSRDAEGKWTPFNALQIDTLVAQYQEDLAWLAKGGGRAAAIGLEGADVTALRRPFTAPQQGADHDPPQVPFRLGRPRHKGAART